MSLFNRSQTRRVSKAGSKLSYQVAYCQGAGAREYQEDSFGLSDYRDVAEIQEKGLFAVLADGMGGMDDGKAVSQAAVSLCLEAFASVISDIPQRFTDGVHAINDSVYRNFNGRGGTTLVIAKIYDERLWWLSVGDSALYLKRGGQVFQLNKEHDCLNQLYLKELFSGGVINKERAENDEDAKRLSEFIGSDGVSETDCSLAPLKLEHGDALLICSDGVSDFIGDVAISTALDRSPSQACVGIEQSVRALGRPDQDNYTAIMIRCAK
jgi:protein phosphatase